MKKTKNVLEPEKQATDLQVNPAEEKLEKEEVKTSEYNLEIVRDYYGNVDPFYLSKKDPEYVYRFLRDEHKNISMKTGNLLLQKGGWQIVPKSHLQKLDIKDSEISPDGLLRRGDQILAFMPKKLYDEKKLYKIDQAKSPMKSVNRMLKEGDPNTGGKEMHETMKGIQTKKALGM